MKNLHELLSDDHLYQFQIFYSTVPEWSYCARVANIAKTFEQINNDGAINVRDCILDSSIITAPR